MQQTLLSGYIYYAVGAQSLKVSLRAGEVGIYDELHLERALAILLERLIDSTGLRQQAEHHEGRHPTDIFLIIFHC